MTSDASPQPIQSAKSAVESLAAVLGAALPGTLASADDPANALLHDAGVARAVVGRLRREGRTSRRSSSPCSASSRALAGVYMSRAVSRKPLAGFEAVLLALYAHAAAQRGSGEAETVSLPNLANPSVYHDAKVPPKTKAAELDVAVLSPALEPHGTMRATRRARIVGAVLELYHGKLAIMPLSSKMEFCEFCVAWTGNRSKLDDKPRVAAASEPAAAEEKLRRVPLPWELFQPVLRIVAHCLLGPTNSDELKTQATRAAECMYWRAAETMDARSVLATRSLVRLSQMTEEPIPEPSFSGAVETNMAELEAMRANILSNKN
ncbi:hypothetical protein OsJ_12390 [Oryza sativa Japonica Group]|uniref:Uncharacterized protein n=1 Tax=Oryza sativa subsp. japonica TaxID=39947 RepID=A3AM71_ORYSJ|nr:hypothetical protein OsJ_12390 [Oryza sativa Japonica Group]